MTNINFKKYIPTKAEEEILGCAPFRWAYVKGNDIVKAYGNNFPLILKENIYYLFISTSDDNDDISSMRVYSNKWLYADYVNIDEKFKMPDSWKYVCEEYQKNGTVCNLNGTLGIVVYMFKLRAILFFDTEEKKPYIIPHEGFREKQKLKYLFDETDAKFGNLSDYYESQKEPQFRELDTRPCGEFASFAQVEYLFCEGWQVLKFMKEHLKKMLLDSKGTYLVFRKPKPSDNNKLAYIFQSNKWEIQEKNKKRLRNRIEPKAKEINSIRYYIGTKNYANQPCKINNKKVILCYPMSTYNPVVWDIEDNSIWVLPSKYYPSDNYCKQLEAHFGKLSFLQNRR